MRKTMHAIRAIPVLAVLFPATVLFAQPVDYRGSIDLVSGNRIETFTQSFSSKALLDILEITSGGAAKGNRYLVTDFTPTVLFCETGLLNAWTLSVEASGVRAGDNYNVLPTDWLFEGTGSPIADNQFLTTNGSWTTDKYKGEYIYLTGIATGVRVDSLFLISGNNVNTVFVDTTRDPLPPYGGVVDYTIISNPPSVADKPQFTLFTSSILTARGETRSINYTVIPVQGDPWNPLNEVDPYVGVLMPSGQLLFLNNGRWHVNATPMFRSYVIGGEAQGVLGVFLITPDLPRGRYEVLGVLNTPGASVFRQEFWRSRLTSSVFELR